jgi:hypothetical protein
MGTSNAYGGPGGGTPLVPTWLEPAGGGAPNATDGTPPAGAPPAASPPPGGPVEPITSPTVPAAPPALPAIPLTPTPGRFSAARSNFSRYARSGGSDRASLGRAVSGYVANASGGARQAARRMGSARTTGTRLLGFLSDAQARGAREALRALNLEGLVGRPLEDVFLGLTDYVCPSSGTVDAGIARDAFIETIAELAKSGITDLDALTAEQMQTVFELYATHAIEARLCNDIGTKVVTLPTDIRAAKQVQEQLEDYIRRGVSDALAASQAAFQDLTPERVQSFVDGVYEAAFEILRTMGEAEAET